MGTKSKLVLSVAIFFLAVIRTCIYLQSFTFLWFVLAFVLLAAALLAIAIKITKTQ